MPTIDQLAAAPAASDGDLFPASQSGTVRRVTRTQILAGMQPELVVLAGNLLGRTSTGAGAPEQIMVGPGLTLAAGILGAVATEPSLVGQDASKTLVTPTGALTPRTLAALFATSVSPESFGAIGDGITDDTVALNAAIATLRPVRLGARIYATTGQWTITTSAVLLGAPGQTMIRRAAQSSGGAWISIQCSSITAFGIIFDANRSAISQETWSLLVTASCSQSHFRSCVFTNARGASLGNGLTIQASDPTASNHIVDDCEAYGNDAHGIWLEAIEGARITSTRAHDNSGYGLCADFNDSTFQRQVRLCSIVGNHCWNNVRGISIGNFNVTNQQPPVWGNANPDAIGFLITANICHDNTFYGIAVAGSALSVVGNLLSNNGTISNGGAGILANCAYSQVASNVIIGGAQFGVDAGGSIALNIASNYISGSVIGINPGGSLNVRVAENYIAAIEWGITVYNVETDGHGSNFGRSTSNIIITDNTINMTDSAGGVYLIDAPQSALVAGNVFLGSGSASVGQCLFAHTDSVIIENNRWNNTPRIFANPILLNGRQTVQLPDIADEIMVTSAPAGVQSMMTQHQVATLGQICFIKVVNPGGGYTHASVTVTGSGTGAAAFAYICNGMLIGVGLSSPGSGYGALGATATVTIAGDGQNASAAVSVGLPVIEGRRIRVLCNTAVSFARSGSSPLQENWTLTDAKIPANAAITFTGTFGSWRADSVPLADYITPPGDGSLTLRTVGSTDLTLQPSSGHVRIATDADPTGYLVVTGHGSPVGVVAAPPGSDYRNLDGGVAQTLWIKQAGYDASGWFAIA